jgi:hypothetical protein
MLASRSLPEKSAMPLLLRGMRDFDETVRLAAVQGAPSLKGGMKLLEAGAQDSSATVRLFTASMLGDLQSKKDKAAGRELCFRMAVSADEDSEVLSYLTESIEKIGPPEAGILLDMLVRGDRSPTLEDAETYNRALALWKRLSSSEQADTRKAMARLAGYFKKPARIP